MTYNSSKHSLSILKNGQSIDQISTNKVDTSLLASYDGAEVIHHTLKKGARWGLAPNDSQAPLEAVYILSGKLLLKTEHSSFFLEKHDFVSGTPVEEHIVFRAEEDTTFLYITSEPVYHHYSHSTKELTELAVSIEKKDGYTSKHCLRIKDLSMQVGEKIGLNAKQLQVLNFGSLLHDIGKLKIPTSILAKPEKLTEQEWETMKLHPVYGADILRKEKSKDLIEAADIVEQHHERYNGSGYPKGLKESEIIVEASIVGLVDSYDAMTSDRVYQKKLTIEQAINEIKKMKGILYHPDVVDAFIAVMEENSQEGGK